MPPNPPLSTTLPPLILGTATFNSQYNQNPYTLPTTTIIHHALTHNIRAFDTSPYYGPSEDLLGQALSTPEIRHAHPRDSYHLLTKVGRLAASSFDYSPAWVRRSVERSLARLRTDYLDVVYCHDVEFVSVREVLGAVCELRRIRDEEYIPISGSTGAGGRKKIHHIGISGYPVHHLAYVAETVLRETGEPLDVVMSYANFTLQNTRLHTEGVQRLKRAGVDVVLNASVLGMGLLRGCGVPVGGMGDFHPAPVGLRGVVGRACEWLRDNAGGDAGGGGDDSGRLEVLAIRFAVEGWLSAGSSVGTTVSGSEFGDMKRVGATVMGVSSLDELHETLRVWRAAVRSFNNNNNNNSSAISDQNDNRDRDEIQRQHRIDHLVQGIRSVLGPDWVDYVWPSPSPGFVNSLSPEHVAMRDGVGVASL